MRTSTKIDLHIILAPRYRQSLLLPRWREDLYRMMTYQLQAWRHRVYIINGMPDHLHLLIDMHPDWSQDALIGELKMVSAGWINRTQLPEVPFEWKEGYGLFTVSRCQVPEYYQYIAQQEELHRRESFGAEFRRILQEQGLEYPPDATFHLPENAGPLEKQNASR
ncbi:IS200/IS605 family transposase [Flaviaesturariibacter amylovorans]|uniref:IS200/IS605 family transposase n=1 Tax=Flaviaesturariibacter amylovorans TaxID=1084520 RepID=A0ABP8H104_9BACT